MGSKNGAGAAEEDKAKHPLDLGTGILTRPHPTGNPQLAAAAPQEMLGTQAQIQSSIIHLFIYGDFLPQNRTMGWGCEPRLLHREDQHLINMSCWGQEVGVTWGKGVLQTHR